MPIVGIRRGSTRAGLTIGRNEVRVDKGSMVDRRTCYPHVEPYDQGTLEVSKIHTIHYEQSGNPKGKPAVFVHGGPGGGTDPRQRRFFDPARYRTRMIDAVRSGLVTFRSSRMASRINSWSDPVSCRDRSVGNRLLWGVRRHSSRRDRRAFVVHDGFIGGVPSRLEPKAAGPLSPPPAPRSLVAAAR